MENNKNKSQTIFLSVIGIATLLVAIIGATFAWFSASVSGNDSASSVEVSTAVLGVSFTDGAEIKLDKAVPGDNGQKSFTVAAGTNATVAQDYKINLKVTSNTFVDKTDLVYSLSGTSDKTGTELGTVATAVTNQQAPAADAEIGAGSVKPDETHTYTFTLLFKSLNEDQNDNQGKAFLGAIQVSVDNVG